MGLRVHAVGRPDDVGIRSRYGEISILREDKDFSALIEKIIKAGFGGSLAYVTSDYFLQLIYDGRTDILGMFNFSISPLPTLRILSDKYATYEHAAKLGIRTPATLHLQNYDEIAPDLLPLILKWNETPLGMRVPFKTQVFENSESLKSIERLPVAFHKYLLLQQLVVGTDLSYAGYFQDNREVLGCVTEKRRQYPIWGGLGSYVADYTGPAYDECLEAGRALARNLNVNGFLEVEFKYDEHGHLYLIEANPRIWGWAKFFKLKCENFSDVLLDKHVDPIMNQNNCKWFSLLRDGKAIWSLLRTDSVIRVMAEVFDSYQGDKIFDVFELNDLRPFFHQFFKGFKRDKQPDF